MDVFFSLVPAGLYEWSKTSHPPFIQTPLFVYNNYESRTGSIYKPTLACANQPHSDRKFIRDLCSQHFFPLEFPRAHARCYFYIDFHFAVQMEKENHNCLLYRSSLPHRKALSRAMMFFVSIYLFFFHSKKMRNVQFIRIKLVGFKKISIRLDYNEDKKYL